MADTAKVAEMAKLADMPEEAPRAETTGLVQCNRALAPYSRFDCCNAIIPNTTVAATAPASSHTALPCVGNKTAAPPPHTAAKAASVAPLGSPARNPLNTRARANQKSGSVQPA